MLGTEELIQYIEKYDLNFNTSVITSRLPKVPWEEYVDLNNTDRRNYASPEAIDLLQHLLVYVNNYFANVVYAQYCKNYVKCLFLWFHLDTITTSALPHRKPSCTHTSKAKIELTRTPYTRYTTKKVNRNRLPEQPLCEHILHQK